MEDSACTGCIQTKSLFKVRGCSHRFCATCSTSEETPNCSECKEMKRKYLSTPFCQPKSDADLKRKFLANKEELAKNMEARKRYFTFLENGISQLERMESNGIDSKESLSSVMDLNEKFHEFESILRAKEFLTVTVNLNNSDRSSYLEELCTRIKERERVFAVHPIQGEDKFAEISLEDDFLFVHAFSSLIPEDDATVVWDLKKCFIAEDDLVFLKYYCPNVIDQYVLVRMTNHPLNHQFIKLCTGELGPVYKGASYTKGDDKIKEGLQSVVEVCKYMVNGKENSGQVDYVAGSAWTTCVPGERVISGSNDGKFNIHKFTGPNVTELFTIIGKVIKTFSSLEDIDFVVVEYENDERGLTVEDCGLALKVKS